MLSSCNVPQVVEVRDPTLPAMGGFGARKRGGACAGEQTVGQRGKDELYAGLFRFLKHKMES